jgi:hypothetical protein
VYEALSERSLDDIGVGEPVDRVGRLGSAEREHPEAAAFAPNEERRGDDQHGGIDDRHRVDDGLGQLVVLELVRERVRVRVRPSRDDGQGVRQPRVVAVAGGEQLLDEVGR